jgi:hypothetical protein
MDKRALGQERIFLQPRVSEKSRENAPNRKFRPAALKQDQPNVTEGQETDERHKEQKVLRQKCEKYAAGHKQHGRSPDAGPAEIADHRGSQSEGHKLE